MSKQISLFGQQPSSPDEISRRTPLSATFDLFTAFLRGEGKSEHTIKAFRGDMNLLARFAGADHPIARFKTSDLHAYLDWMERERGVPCSRKTFARRVTTLKVYFKWLQGINALAFDPALPIRQRSGPAPLSDVLSAEQITKCIAVSRMMEKGGQQDLRAELLFRLLLAAGIKKAETGRLKFHDIDRSNSELPMLYIRHKVRDVYKERRIELDSALLTLIERYQEQYGLEDEVFNCTARNLEYILTDIGRRAGVEFKLSFEVMRWTMAVREYQADADEDKIREKLGLSKTSWYETGDKIKRLAARLKELSDAASASKDAQK